VVAPLDVKVRQLEVRALPWRTVQNPWETWLANAMAGAADARERLASPRVAFEARRKAIHVFGAIVAVPVFLLLPFEAALLFALAIMALIVVVHVAERRRIASGLPAFLHKPVATALEVTRRPHESFPWPPILFLVALIVIGTANTWAGFSKAYAFAAFGILGVGDAASALIGVAYGRRMLPWNSRKSFEGTLAGFVASYVAAALLASIAYTVRLEVMPPAMHGVVALGALAGALIETLPRVEDNLFVPLGAYAAMIGAAFALGSPLA